MTASADDSINPHRVLVARDVFKLVAICWKIVFFHKAREPDL
jgi:hypothetical protein